MTNRYNLIMKINAKNQVKALLSYENVKLKDLVVKMSELSGKNTHQMVYRTNLAVIV